MEFRTFSGIQQQEQASLQSNVWRAGVILPGVKANQLVYSRLICVWSSGEFGRDFIKKIFTISPTYDVYWNPKKTRLCCFSVLPKAFRWEFCIQTQKEYRIWPHCSINVIGTVVLIMQIQGFELVAKSDVDVLPGWCSISDRLHSTPARLSGLQVKYYILYLRCCCVYIHSTQQLLS